MTKSEERERKWGIFKARLREIQDFCEGVILLGLAILLAIAVWHNPPAWGADWEQEYERDYGALDMASYIGGSLDNYIDFQRQPGKRETEVLGRGYLIDNILIHQWVITRSVIHGFTGFQAAIDRIRSDYVIQAILFPTARTLHDADTDSGWFASGTAGQGVTQGKKELRIEDVDLTDERLTRSGPYVAHTNYTRVLEQVNQQGFFSGDTIFKKIQYFAIILLGIAVMVRLTVMAHAIFNGDPPLPVEWLRLFLKMIFLLLIMIYSGRMIMFGISMADSIKKMILNGAFAGGNGMDTVMGLVDARMEYADSKMSTSLWRVLTGDLSSFFLNWLSWLAYLLASGSLFVLMIVGDVMMALSAVIFPFVCVFALIPGYEANFPSWIRSYLSLLFYGPLAAVYAVLLVAILTIGIDTSPLAFIVVAVAYALGAAQIPRLAKNLGGAGLAGLAVEIASVPSAVAMTTVRTVVSAGVGVVTGGAGAIITKKGMDAVGAGIDAIEGGLRHESKGERRAKEKGRAKQESKRVLAGMGTVTPRTKGG